MSFPLLYILNSIHLLLLFTFCQVCLPVKETAEFETGMAEKSSWDQANIRQKLGLVGEIERKLAKLSKTTLLTVLPPNYFIILPDTVPLVGEAEGETRCPDLYC
jgi:hypothetical protein